MPDGGYTTFCIWAEENGDLGANAFEWAFGNGSNTPLSDGVVIPVDCELFAMGLNVQGGSATVRAIVDSDASLSTYQVAAVAPQGSITFPTPLAITAGQLINFRTILSSGADTNQGRVSAWFRIRSTPASTSITNDLLDVSIGGIVSGQLMQWNGTSFVPYTIPTPFSENHSDLNLDDGTNPHGTTQTDVGLSNVDNTSDIDKPISTATQNALDLKYDASNPNGYETPIQLDARDTANRDRANHTNTQLSSTISDFTARVKTDETTTSIAIADRTINYTDEDAVVTPIVIPFADHQSISKISDAVGSVGINNTQILTTWLSLTITVPTTGDYDLDWFYNWSHNDGAQDFIGNVRLDGNIVAEHVQEPKDVAGTGVTLSVVGGGTQNSGTSQRYAYSGFLPNQNLTAGVHTLLIEWAGSQNNDRATIYRGSLRAKRIS